MSIQVRIPTQLRTLTKDQIEVSVIGGTVAEVLENVETAYPGVAQRVLDERGQVRRFVNVYLDDEDIRFLNGLETVVVAPARVSIIAAVAGG